jgi:hypothetical protein
MTTSSLTLYTSAKLSLLEGALPLGTAKLQVVLLTSSYAPALTHSTYADISPVEVSGTTGTGYTTGGQALAGGAVAAQGAAAAFVASENTWPGATMAPQYAVLVEMAGAALAPTDKLVGYSTLAAAGLAVANAAFSITWPPTGILSIQ